MLMQRFFDILFSTLALLTLSPLIIICICILRITGEGEVFYLQERVGVDKEVFNLVKFATMVKNSEKLGAGTITLKNDPRVLPFGKFLRKTKINELPQLFNILRGQMSIVGPRPLARKQFSFYSDAEQKIISQMKPGLSGIGSLAFRDEEKFFEDGIDPDFIYKTKISPRKAKLEKWYFYNQSIKLYFLIIFLTIIAVLFPEKNVIDFINSELKS
tara:strand:- start:322 stop:966 length:645 start_codon:yes stop_codon:yes gene_type:complete